MCKQRKSGFDRLDHDMLVEVLRRVTWYDVLYTVCLVNKSWFSAALDSLTYDGVINFNAISYKFNVMVSRYCDFLKRQLDNKPDSFSKLILGHIVLKSHVYAYTAQRTPSLQWLVITPEVRLKHSYILPAMHYWKKLKGIVCPGSLIKFCPDSFQKVEHLRLFGTVDDSAAALVRDRCPRLKRLSLISCALSINALSTILDGHKYLEFLDTRHSFRVSDCGNINSSGLSKSVEWNEKEICHKAALIKVHLKCAQQSCSVCVAPVKCCFPVKKVLCADCKKINRSGLPVSVLRNGEEIENYQGWRKVKLRRTGPQVAPQCCAICTAPV